MNTINSFFISGTIDVEKMEKITSKYTGWSITMIRLITIK